MSWLTELERLQIKYQGMQRDYQQLSENIEALKRDHYKATRDFEKLQIDRDLELAEQEREALEEEIKSVKSQMKYNSAQEIFEELMRLDYAEHVDRFEEFLNQQKSSVFILHGHAGCGLRLLQKRMVQYVFFKTCNKTFPIKMNIHALQKIGYYSNRLTDEFEPHSLWRELGKKLNCRASREEVAARIKQKCQEQTVLLILDELDLTYNVQAIIEKLWRQLLTQMDLGGSQPKNPLLLLLVVAEQTDQMFAEIAIQEHYTPSWKPEIPVKLPPVERYARQDVETWLQFLCQTYPLYRKQCIPDLLYSIFGGGQYAAPEQVIAGIFTHLCHDEFHEGVFQEWLRI